MKRKILLPTDFSDNSWSAIVYALKLYSDEVCTFYFLHSIGIKISTIPSITKQVLESIQENARQELVELKNLSEISNANANHDFQIILSSENLNSAIKKVVKQQSIDLIVMGTKGTTGAAEFLFGSNTISVIKNLSDCAVLIIPEEYDFEVPSQIAFPTDFNRFYDDKELNPLKELADLYNSKIRIVHIIKEEQLKVIQKYNMNTLKEFLRNYEYTFHWMPDYSNKTIAINDFVNELKINVLAMVKYKHSFIENILKEPVIKKIGFKPNIPFLVIPD